MKGVLNTMSQSWKTDVLAEINEYFKTYDASKAKNAMKKGYLTPATDSVDGSLNRLKLTMAGEKFVDDVRKYLRKLKNRT